MTFWVYFDETKDVLSVFAVTSFAVTHLSYAADAIWAIDDHVITWHKDNLKRRNDANSVIQYHEALTSFLVNAVNQQIAISGTTKPKF